MASRRMLFLLLVLANFAAIPVGARAQSLVNSDPSPIAALDAPSASIDLSYTRPTENTKIHRYIFDAAGPFPLVGAAAVAGINQAYNTPPEWGQGAAGFGKRFGSNLGIAAVSTTTRYALAEAFREDTLYYRCDCSGAFPRLKHAMISTVTARRGEDGHRVLSFSSLLAPYAGTTTAVYGWYPDRFGAKDAFRMGNYNLLGSMGGNIAMEFIYGGQHSLFSHLYHSNMQNTSTPGSGR